MIVVWYHWYLFQLFFFLVHFFWAIVKICLLIYSLKVDGVYLFGSFYVAILY